jgi:hypothetical protein
VGSAAPLRVLTRPVDDPRCALKKKLGVHFETRRFRHGTPLNGQTTGVREWWLALRDNGRGRVLPIKDESVVLDLAKAVSFPPEGRRRHRTWAKYALLHAGQSK